jgi:hypothetical protein
MLSVVERRVHSPYGPVLKLMRENFSTKNRIRTAQTVGVCSAREAKPPLCLGR